MLSVVVKLGWVEKIIHKPCLHGSLLSTVNYFKVHTFLLPIKLFASTRDSLLTSGIPSKIQESGFKTTEISPRSLIYWQDLLLSAFTQPTTIDSSALLLRNLGSKNLPVNVFLLIVNYWRVHLHGNY